MWKRYRRLAEIAQAALITGLPFLKVGGESALRFDLVNLKLHFFGAVIWINEFYLVLLAVIFLLLFIVAVTNILGRIWCGWSCPQTVLLDLSGDLAGIFPLEGRPLAQKVVLIPLSALVSLTLICYFVPPAAAFEGLFTSKVITGFFLVQWVLIYADLAFLGRIFCKTVCPYSMLQSGLFDKDTLVIAFDPAREKECKGCDKCARVCPVGIDIKNGPAKECIACAECIDACASMVRNRAIPSLIGYRGNIRRQKAFLLSGVTVLSALVLIVLVSAGPEVDFIVTRNPEQPAAGVNSYTYTVRNNRNTTLRGALSVKGPFLLIGEGQIDLKPYEMIHGRIIAKAEKNRTPTSIVFVLRMEGFTVEREAGFL
ncbi:MAG: 4Fe-4S binding protein [Nitrospirae bacterium]|nr:4Fe-4S binding protein [Nitrospirota bacterium]